MPGDPYLNDDFPCFSSYEATNVQCFDCPHKVECRADTERTVRVNDSYVGRARGTRIARVPTQSPQRATMAVGHSNFTPFPGEGVFTRFGKNAILNCGQAFFFTAADFCGKFRWEPRPPDEGAALHVIGDAEEKE